MFFVFVPELATDLPRPAREHLRNMIEELFAEASDTSDEEDEQEPSESEPGQRLLWGAQRGKLELVKEIVETAANPKEVVRHADSDGYTALHRDDDAT